MPDVLFEAEGTTPKKPKKSVETPTPILNSDC
jgi:hypothetical protein